MMRAIRLRAIGRAVLVGKFDRLNLDAVKGLRATLSSMLKYQLICFRANHIPRVVILVGCNEIRN